MANNSPAPYRIGVVRPAPALDPFVRYYGYRQACLVEAVAVHPLNARTAPTLLFEFSDADASVRIPSAGEAPIKLPRSIVHGMQTACCGELHIKGRIDSFDIVFQPDGLEFLFALPAKALTDFSFDAESVFGRAISMFQEQMEECKSLDERISTANQFLLQRVRTSRTQDGISVAARQILLGAGEGRIPAMAQGTGLSVRQFRRRFLEKIGMSPKLFARIARFESALDCMGRLPEQSWTDIAYRFGYYDQMHMVHEFAQFTGKTPTQTLNHFEAALRQNMTQTRFDRASSSDQEPWLL
jgi:AraC-like DNA-binding protein